MAFVSLAILLCNDHTVSVSNELSATKNAWPNWVSKAKKENAYRESKHPKDGEDQR